MKKKWKILTALSLAAFLGFVTPVSAIEAAQENTEDAPAPEEPATLYTEESNASASEGQAASDPVESSAPSAEDPSDPDAEQSNAAALHDSTDGDAEPVSTPQAQTLYAADSDSAPAVKIVYQDQNLAQSMGGTIAYDRYINNRDQCLRISIGQNDSLASLSYYLDNTDGSAISRSEEELDSLWQTADQLSGQEVSLAQDGKYVLYVRAEDENNQTTCVRTDGIVIDSISPVITGVQDGGTYPPGTKFEVKDDNLDTVLINEQAAAPAEDGTYQAAANGMSCMIRAKDKAGHETTCSLTIQGEGADPDDDETQDDSSVISKNGTYTLHAGTAYRLGGGTWILEGDLCVYRGGMTFYVDKTDDYTLKRH